MTALRMTRSFLNLMQQNFVTNVRSTDIPPGPTAAVMVAAVVAAVEAAVEAVVSVVAPPADVGGAPRTMTSALLRVPPSIARITERFSFAKVKEALTTLPNNADEALYDEVLGGVNQEQLEDIQAAVNEHLFGTRTGMTSTSKRPSTRQPTPAASWARPSMPRM